MVTLIGNNEAIIVVDGSFLPDSGIATASWVLAGQVGEVTVVGFSRLPEGNKSNDPYRAELFGLCLALSVLQVVHKQQPDLRGTVAISCDNDEALRHGIEHDMWPRATAPHFDLIAVVHKFRKSIPYKLVPQRVRGHQDQTGRELCRLEELNVVADQAARTMAYIVERDGSIQSDIQSLRSQWRVQFADIILKKDIRNTLTTAITGKYLIDHWIDRGKFTQAQVRLVDWEALCHAERRKPMHHQRWATKFISGFCGSYKKLHQIGKHPTPMCPRCNLFEESTSHVLLCQHHSSCAHRLESLEQLASWLDNTQTRWDIRDTILDTLRELQPTSTLSAHVPFNPYDDKIFVAARAQDSIGMVNFLEGFISKEWHTIMAHYYREIKSSRTASSWTAGLHFHMQKFARSQWDHRNSIVHARNAKGRKITSEKEIQARLEYQLSMGIRFLPAHLHHLASFNVADALTQPRSKMLAWLYHLEVVRPFYEETETREVNTQRIFLRHWLRI